MLMRSIRVCDFGRSLYLVVVSALLGSFLAGPAEGSIQCTTGACCVDDVNGSRGANCTSNDVTFTVVGLGTQTDGCISASDTVSILMRANVRNNTAQNRYDIGLYVATDSDPNGDGAISGQCYRERLSPASPTTFIDDGLNDDCLGTDGTLLDLLRTVAGPNASPDDNGYYLTAETGASNSTRDACGDLADENTGGCDLDLDGSWDDSVLQFTTPVVLSCDDIDSDGALPDTSNDGFVNIPTCATWGNQANEVFTPTGGGAPNDTCDSEAELVNGTAAKCKCEDSNSTIPRPSLACDDVDDAGVPGDERTVFCTPSTIQVGQSATCTVRYNNQVACTPNLATAERFRCGAASYVRFRTDFNESFGTVSGLAVGGSGTGSAGTVTESGNQVILWTPTSALGSSGVIQQSEFTTLTFTFTATAASTGALSFPTTVYWSNANSFSPETAQTVASCGANLTTPVTLAALSSTRGPSGGVDVEWTTATEAGQIGFNLYEETAAGLRKLNRELIAATGVDSLTPHTYHFSFAGSASGRLVIEDVDVRGGTKRQGPFSIGEPHGRVTEPQRIDWAPLEAQVQAALETGGQRTALLVAPADVRLLVDRDGLYRVSHEALAAAGFDLSGTPIDQLAVTLRGRPVAVRLGGGGPKGRSDWGSGRYFVFFGNAASSLDTDTNVYLLSVDRARAQRMPEDPAPPQGTPAVSYIERVRLARNRDYSFASPIADPWFDTRMLAFRNSARFDFDLATDHALASSGGALAVRMWGVTDWPAAPDHHVRVSINGVAVGEQTFDGRAETLVNGNLAVGVVREGTNQVTLELPGDSGVDFDMVSLESIELSYPRALVARSGLLEFEAQGASFEVRGLPASGWTVYRIDPAGPVRLAGATVRSRAGVPVVAFPGGAQAARFWVGTDSASLLPRFAAGRGKPNLLQGRANSILLIHPSLAGGVDRLAAQHQARGLTTKVVDVFDVYEAYSDGVVDAAAIRAYLSDAARRTGARFVTLVGSATYDPKNYLGLGSFTLIPTLYGATGEFVNFGPSDALLADGDGDGVQDLAIGRLPVRSPAELTSLLDKIDDFEARGYGGRAVLAADFFDPRAGLSFTDASERFATSIPADWTVFRAYLDRSGLAAARSELLQRINEGVGLTAFAGHSGPTTWTFSSLFDATDAANLSNAGAPTVVLQWGCWNTYFVEPRFDTLGHTLLAQEDRGAVAVLGSATLLETASADRFASLLSERLFTPGTTLGEAVLAAKQSLAAGGNPPRDILLGFTLLGDPTLSLTP